MKLLASGSINLGRPRVETPPHINGAEERPAEGTALTLESLFHCVPAALIIANSGGRITMTNEAARQMLGYTEKDLATMAIGALVHPDDAPAEAAAVQHVLDGYAARVETRRRTLDSYGRSLPTIACHFTVAGMDGPLYACLIRDITTQVEAENLKETEVAMYSAASDVLASADLLEHAIPMVLKALCHSSGWILGAFWRVDVQTQLLHCRSVWQDPNDTAPHELFNRHATYAAGVGLPGQVWASGEPAWRTNVEDGATVATAFRKRGPDLWADFCFPVVILGEVHGVFQFFSRQEVGVGAKLVPVMSTISSQIGTHLGHLFERERVSETLRVSEERYRSITEIVTDAIVTIDQAGTIQSVNRAAETTFGYAEGELAGQPITELMPPSYREAHVRGFERYLASGQRVMRWEHLEMPGLHKSGRELQIELSLSEFDQDGKRSFTGYMRDITQQQMEQSALAHQALHDSLTELPNRQLFIDRLQTSISIAHRHEMPLALLIVDLDRFHEVNETFGHPVGDRLLQEVSRRLTNGLRDSDTLARLGGDEFAILLPKTDSEGASFTGNRLLEELATPYELHGYNFRVGASVGMAVLPEHGTDAATLMQRASTAMNVAKRAGGGQAVYSTSRDQNNSARLLLTGELRTAIESDHLLLHYQPKVNLSDGRTEHVEALVRWQHPERGLIAPDRFIPLAEETGLVRPLTLWVLNRALSQQRQWVEQGYDVRVAVNVSARILHDPELLSTVLEMLVRWDVEPSRLMIEITESAIMVDPEGAMKSLVELHTAGVWTSIDDFGTGYSSLGYLKRLPVDEIKIDKSFVLDMATSRDDVSIVRSVVTLGHNLGLKVVAEGVDNKRTLDMLGAMDCDMAQGFYLSRPLPASEMLAWLDGATGQKRRIL